MTARWSWGPVRTGRTFSRKAWTWKVGDYPKGIQRGTARTRRQAQRQMDRAFNR